MKLPQNLPPEILKHLPVELLKSLPDPPRETEEQMIATVAIWVDHIADGMTVEAGQRPLRNAIRSCVRDGTLPTLQVIKAAERYREIDMALRELIAEGLDSAEGMTELSRTSLKAFQQQAMLRDITKDPKGHNLGNYNRDIAIVVLMALTMVCWPYLRKSHNRASKKVSASYIVSEALNRRRVTNISATRVVEIYDDCHLIAERLSGLVPAL